MRAVQVASLVVGSSYDTLWVILFLLKEERLDPVELRCNKLIEFCSLFYCFFHRFHYNVCVLAFSLSVFPSILRSYHILSFLAFHHLHIPNFRFLVVPLVLTLNWSILMIRTFSVCTVPAQNEHGNMIFIIKVMQYHLFIRTVLSNIAVSSVIIKLSLT